jgi:hypothetical protein
LIKKFKDELFKKKESGQLDEIKLHELKKEYFDKIVTKYKSAQSDDVDSSIFGDIKEMNDLVS